MANNSLVSGCDPQHIPDHTIAAEPSAFSNSVTSPTPPQPALSYTPLQTKTLTSAPFPVLPRSRSDTGSYTLSKESESRNDNLAVLSPHGLESVPRHFQETSSCQQKVSHESLESESDDPVSTLTKDDTSDFERGVSELSLDPTPTTTLTSLTNSGPHQHSSAGKSAPGAAGQSSSGNTASGSGRFNKRPSQDDTRGLVGRNISSNEQDEESDDDQNGEPTSSKRVRLEGAEAETFSCPFWKRNKVRFNCVTHPACANNEFKEISKLKLHIKTHHKKPSDECRHCLSTVSTAEKLAAHQGLEPTQICTLAKTHQDDPEDGITKDMENKLTSKKENMKVDSWKGIWNVIFPKDRDIDIPSSRYENCKEASITQFRAAVIQVIDRIDQKIRVQAAQPISTALDSEDSIQPSADPSLTLTIEQALFVAKEEVSSLLHDLDRMCEGDTVRKRTRRGRTSSSKTKSTLGTSKTRPDIPVESTSTPASTHWPVGATSDQSSYASQAIHQPFMAMPQPSPFSTASSTHAQDRYWGSGPSTSPSPSQFNTYTAYTEPSASFHITDVPHHMPSAPNSHPSQYPDLEEHNDYAANNNEKLDLASKHHHGE